MPHKDIDQKNAYHRAYYRANKAEINSRQVGINRVRRHDRYVEIQELKAKPCTDCGVSFPYYVMDFDHRDRATKTMDISVMVKRMFSWGAVLAELSKCDLVCTRCHRLRTYGGDTNYRSRLYRLQKAALEHLKSSTPCFDCAGVFAPCQMDFDHVTPGTKVENVARAVGRSTDLLLAEIAKCHLVCANCHRERGFSGARPFAPRHQEELVSHLRAILDTLPMPEDKRRAPFPLAHLLGQVSDQCLAEQAGISRSMVAWYRRKAGIAAPRQQRNAA